MLELHYPMIQFLIIPNSLKPLFQSEARCEDTDMKMISYSHATKTHFHNKGFFKIEGFWNPEMACEECEPL